jgi:hypothetical protein
MIECVEPIGHRTGRDRVDNDIDMNTLRQEIGRGLQDTCVSFDATNNGRVEI